MARKNQLAKPVIDALCPCESGTPYKNCCAPYHLGTPAPNAEALMRSRYTAYKLGLEAYLLHTWHPDTRPSALHLHEDQATQWLGLQVKQVTSSESTATVNFVAHYKIDGKAHRLCELSQFVRLDNAWYYLIGNDPDSDTCAGSDNSY